MGESILPRKQMNIPSGVSSNAANPKPQKIAMKTLLGFLVVAVTLAFAAPQAEARDHRRYHKHKHSYHHNHHRHHRHYHPPVRHYYTPQYYSSGSYYRPRYRTYSRHHHYCPPPRARVYLPGIGIVIR
jgi:Ni/Co efflux regulator RcnB